MNVNLKQQKHTLQKMIAIFLVMIIGFLPTSYNHSLYGYLPGLGITAFLLVSALYLLVMRHRIRFETDHPDLECKRGETVSVALKLMNDSVLICPKATVTLFLSDSFGNEVSKAPATFVMEGKSQKEFHIQSKMDHIGVYTAGIGMVEIYDLTGLFSVTMRSEKNFQITVLPRIGDSEELKLEEKQLTESQNPRKSAVGDGFDCSGAREYAIGDSMKKIHWKLSARSKDYMTKVTESNKKSELIVIVDFNTKLQNREQTLSVYDFLIETALSLVEQALRKEAECSLLFVGRDREINRIFLKGEQDYRKLIMLLPEAGERLPDWEDLLEQEKHLSNKSNNLILCTAMPTERMMQELERCGVPYIIATRELSEYETIS